LPSSDTFHLVLVVEDEVFIRLHLAQSIREAGFQVIEAASGEEAIDVLRSGERIDILLTDISLPGVSGLHVAELFRKHRPATKIVISSAHKETLDWLHGMFVKPYKMCDLIDRLVELTASQDTRERDTG
jgi:CheY-like chemotaxis protein